MQSGLFFSLLLSLSKVFLLVSASNFYPNQRYPGKEITFGYCGEGSSENDEESQSSTDSMNVSSEHDEADEEEGDDQYISQDEEEEEVQDDDDQEEVQDDDDQEEDQDDEEEVQDDDDEEEEDQDEDDQDEEDHDGDEEDQDEEDHDGDEDQNSNEEQGDSADEQDSDNDTSQQDEEQDAQSTIEDDADTDENEDNDFDRFVRDEMGKMKSIDLDDMPSSLWFTVPNQVQFAQLNEEEFNFPEPGDLPVPEQYVPPATLATLARNMSVMSHDSIMAALSELQTANQLHFPLHDHCGWNLLHEAIHQDQYYLAELLISPQFGFDPKAFDPYFGGTVNLVKSKEMAGLLRDKGINLQSYDACHLYSSSEDSARSRRSLELLQLTSVLKLKSSDLVTALKKNQSSVSVTKYKAKRDQMFKEAIDCNARRRVRSAQIQIEYTGEQGIDRNGLKVDFINLMKRALIDEKVLVKLNGSSMYTFNQNADREKIVFAGYIVGLSVFHKVPLNIRFTPIIYHVVCGLNVYRETDFLKLLAAVDPDFYTGVVAIKDMDDSLLSEFEYPETLGATHRAKRTKRSLHKREDLVEFMSMKARSVVFEPYVEVFNAFRMGVESAISCDIVGQHVSPDELGYILLGQADYKAKDWKEACLDFKSSAEFKSTWDQFFEVIDLLTPKQRAELLKFTTSLDSLSVEGFLGLEPRPDVSILSTPKGVSPDDRLPTASTCFNQIKFPHYSSRDVLKARLITAIENCGGFFVA